MIYILCLFFLKSFQLDNYLKTSFSILSQHNKQYSQYCQNNCKFYSKFTIFFPEKLEYNQYILYLINESIKIYPYDKNKLDKTLDNPPLFNFEIQDIQFFQNFPLDNIQQFENVNDQLKNQVKIDDKILKFQHYETNCLIFKINQNQNFNYICNNVIDKIQAFQIALKEEIQNQSYDDKIKYKVKIIEEDQQQEAFLMVQKEFIQLSKTIKNSSTFQKINIFQDLFSIPSKHQQEKIFKLDQDPKLCLQLQYLNKNNSYICISQNVKNENQGLIDSYGQIQTLNFKLNQNYQVLSLQMATEVLQDQSRSLNEILMQEPWLKFTIEFQIQKRSSLSEQFIKGIYQKGLINMDSYYEFKNETIKDFIFQTIQQNQQIQKELLDMIYKLKIDFQSDKDQIINKYEQHKWNKQLIIHQKQSELIEESQKNKLLMNYNLDKQINITKLNINMAINTFQLYLSSQQNIAKFERKEQFKMVCEGIPGNLPRLTNLLTMNEIDPYTEFLSYMKQEIQNITYV